MRAMRAPSLRVEITPCSWAPMISSSKVAGMRGPRWSCAIAIEGTPELERQRQRLLQELLHARQELGAVGAVEDAVVADERQLHLVAGDDAAGVVDGGLLGELADGQ